MHILSTIFSQQHMLVTLRVLLPFPGGLSLAPETASEVVTDSFVWLSQKPFPNLVTFPTAERVKIDRTAALPGSLQLRVDP